LMPPTNGRGKLIGNGGKLYQCPKTLLTGLIGCGLLYFNEFIAKKNPAKAGFLNSDRSC